MLTQICMILNMGNAFILRFQNSSIINEHISLQIRKFPVLCIFLVLGTESRRALSLSFIPNPFSTLRQGFPKLLRLASNLDPPALASQLAGITGVLPRQIYRLSLTGYGMHSAKHPKQSIIFIKYFSPFGFLIKVINSSVENLSFVAGVEEKLFFTKP